ncbi:branched-chain amino acid ABC transporter permease [Xanthobacter autotrophicus]|uniref:branched-chain amino acid ABC transporter permease n=1 Tax=Xanthobacter autotrophicus TaxID=280 RepID=UPI001E5E843D|nr:branched-chain amino acid ABC transporter permease [Xanthobacter autotrophicus]UDQ88311.1 branched-chain amino acid ABC transporter permease [Xanthobacter autotrophicus]
MTPLMTGAIVNAVALGILYGLLGLSLTIIYGAMRIANLAHGEMVLAGSYVAYVVTTQLGYSPLAAIPVAFTLLFLLAFALFAVAGRRLQTARDPEMASFLFFYGVSLMVGSGLLFLFDADARSVIFQFQPISYRVLGLVIPKARVVAVGVALVLVPALFLFLYRTTPGKALRAAVMNRDALRIVGVDVERLSLVAFSVSAGIAGVTGVLLALVFPAFTPFSGLDYTIAGFVVIVLGGLGSPLGALLGGMLFAFSEQLTTLWIGQSAGVLAGFLILVLVVAIRPAGLIGQAEWKS